MREAVLAAPTGDDVYGEDPTVKQLEQRVADLLGKEAAMFIPTGCMSNHCAIAAHCARGDELICGTKSHIFNYEGGHASVMMGVGMYPVETQPDGTLALTHVHAAIRVDDPHFPRSALLCLENSHNMCGGKALSPAYMTQAGQFAVKHGLKLHVDGARLANAAVAQNTSCASLVTMADTVSMCLSKGLGAPLGSVLAGSDATMYHTRRTRKLLGGGMRQVRVAARDWRLSADTICKPGTLLLGFV
jgi:threonine aldolase